MAEPEDRKDEVENKETDRERYNHHYWGAKLLAVCGVIFLIFIVIGVISTVTLHYRRFNGYSGAAFPGPVMMRGYYGGQTYVRHMGFGAGNENQQQLSGVVTAVNGNGFTIAGGGSSNTVQTNSSTQYYESQKPVVNDTVSVYGTTNNGTFTATEVVVE
ncbi:hypothetical protein KGQ71_04935 [Patescibacteria group bacterium]|nr:hypothetical protein [Patescibacteria group bacterium]